MPKRAQGQSWCAAIFVASLLAAGCGRNSGLPTAPVAGRSPAPAEIAALKIADPFVPFAAGNFSDPTNIDNPWLPLAPGTVSVFEGVANRGGGLLPHRVVFTVTDVTKEIAGVRTVVVWDQDFSDGVLVESELAFFAQDDAGHVWSLGEYPEEYAGGQFAGAPSVWIPGIDGARAGTMMLADPSRGTSYYLQGYAPAIAFLDYGKVYSLGGSTCVPAGCYDGVLITDEKSPLDHGGHQRKTYATGVGNVEIGAVGDPEGETLVLTQQSTLDSRGLRAARRAVFQLEAHAYQISEAYKQTAPAQ